MGRRAFSVRRALFAADSSKVVLSGEGGGDERSWLRTEFRVKKEVDILSKRKACLLTMCGLIDGCGARVSRASLMGLRSSK